MSFTVYKHTNNKNGKVYIGITSQNPYKRWQNGKGYKKTFFYNAIKKYGWDNFTHEILKEGLTKEEAGELETELISKYNSTNRDYGYNISRGAKYEQIRLGIKKYGKNNNHSTPVNQINAKTKHIIKKWESQNMAATALKINRKGITKCCLGQCKTYKGYVWEYANKAYIKPHKYEKGKYPHNKICKKVKMITPDGTEFHFNSVKEASKFVNLIQSSVSRYLYGTRKDKTGRRWYFENALD